LAARQAAVLNNDHVREALCPAAALANLELFEKENLLDALQEKISFLSEGLLISSNNQNGIMSYVFMVNTPQGL